MINEQAIEIAMTQRVGPTGASERYLRPPSVRAIADRMQRWRGEPETCQNCHSLPAFSIRAGTPLCSRCRDNRMLQRVVASLRPHATRADEADETKRERLEGYAIVFNKKSVELWGFKEVIRPAAADRMEAEKPDLRALWNHNSDLTIGRVSAGTLTARKRTRGVWTEIEPPKWAQPQVESVERRDITGMSFAFIALEDDWHLEDGEVIREVLDMEVLEVSGVSFPAYPDTTLRVVNAGQRSSFAMERQSAERLRLAR